MERMVRSVCLLWALAGCFSATANNSVSSVAGTERKLNNLVSELVDAPLADGEYRFTLKKAGWVHIAFDKPHFGAEAFVDGGEKPAAVCVEAFGDGDRGRRGVDVPQPQLSDGCGTRS